MTRRVAILFRVEKKLLPLIMFFFSETFSMINLLVIKVNIEFIKIQFYCMILFFFFFFFFNFLHYLFFEKNLKVFFFFFTERKKKKKKIEKL